MVIARHQTISVKGAWFPAICLIAQIICPYNSGTVMVLVTSCALSYLHPAYHFIKASAAGLECS